MAVGSSERAQRQKTPRKNALCCRAIRGQSPSVAGGGSRPKRAAFEHLIAESSTSLINCPPGEIDSKLAQALGELGRAMGVDRAYLTLAETPVRVYAWSVDGSPYPSGWPEAALTLPEQIEEVRFGIVAVPNVALLPAGNPKTTLMTFGVQGWACVSLLMPEPRSTGTPSSARKCLPDAPRC
jgi:hypothetical protein